MEQKRAKILMIGNKDSGKTTYMACAYGLLKKGVYDFRVQGDSENDAWLSKIYRGVKYGSYPLPTDKRGRYHFELFFEGQQFLSFEWLDYFGGVINESKSEDLQRDIETADAVMLFFEAEALLNDDKKKTQFRRILALISEKVETLQRYFNIIIILTKYDNVGNSVSFEEVCRPLEHFKEAASNNENIYFRIVPVSCTKAGLVNVDLPLLDILHSCVADNYSSLAAQLDSAHSSYKYHLAESSVFDSVFSWWTSTTSNKQRAYRDHARMRELESKLDNMSEPLAKLALFIAQYQVTIPEATVSVCKDEEGTTRRNRFGF